MDISSGMEVGLGKCLFLKKTIYELVESSRQFLCRIPQSTEELWIHKYFGGYLSMGQIIQFRNRHDGNLCV
jgi:hypothetical protein